MIRRYDGPNANRLRLGFAALGMSLMFYPPAARAQEPTKGEAGREVALPGRLFVLALGCGAILAISALRRGWKAASASELTAAERPASADGGTVPREGAQPVPHQLRHPVSQARSDTQPDPVPRSTRAGRGAVDPIARSRAAAAAYRRQASGVSSASRDPERQGQSVEARRPETA